MLDPTEPEYFIACGDTWEDTKLLFDQSRHTASFIEKIKKDERDAKESLEKDIDHEITPEFDNKYEGRTAQLPNFAVVYSFLNMFGTLLGLPLITLPALELSIDTTTEFSSSRVRNESNILEILHLKLFRKLQSRTGRIPGICNVSPNRLVKLLIKLCQYMNLPLSCELEQFGYNNLTSDQKLTLLKVLCEIQFDEYPFRRDFLELYHEVPSVLRLPAFGCEQNGNKVWLHEDNQFNIHVYAGQDNDPDGVIWRLRVASLSDMVTYISKLKVQTKVNPKDVAAIEIKKRCVARKDERQRKKAEKDLHRKKERERWTMEKNRSTGYPMVNTLSYPQAISQFGQNSAIYHYQQLNRDPIPPILISESSSEEDEEGEEVDEEDWGCIQCYEKKSAESVLLCDRCDAPYHTLCLHPPVIDIPHDDWFCPHCNQVMLVDKLELKYVEIKTKLIRKERIKKRRNFYGILSSFL